MQLIMAHQQALILANSHHCILSFPKISPKVLVSHRSVSIPVYSAIKGRIQACLAAQTDQPVCRQFAEFPSDIWKHSNAFTSVASRIFDFDQTYGNKIQELKDKVKNMLTAPTKEPEEKASLINSLCRMHGYKMSCDVFNKFKEGDGELKKCLTNDAKGMLSLYEASHLRIHGEDILDEALAFTKAHLKSLAEKSSPHLKSQIIKSLKMPSHKRIPREEAVEYISFYEEEESRDETLLLFSCSQSWILTGWWNDTNLASKLPYIRDRIVEDYVWGVGTYFEPCHSHARVIWTKVVMLTSVIDDTYDAYPYDNLEELQLLTGAIQRWDNSALDKLPDYMKTVYGGLLKLFDDVNNELPEKERSYRLSYTKDTFEQKRGHAASGVETYMKVYGVCRKEAIEKINLVLENAWKDINEECLKPTPISQQLLLTIVNATRAAELFYKDGDGYTFPQYLKDHITQLFVEPIPI
ncbi:hypothetical protein Ddye_027033 [Dipteronia dyeriana]|uniref:Uncharacterized protein n=1 Tax=Dipteronia dyeriana TaxID=168575 RepID=A0AAD9TNS7_9ROSI|nr:hypothetical protein Ddye_027033 [Dipteronia dyeriana]